MSNKLSGGCRIRESWLQAYNLDYDKKNPKKRYASSSDRPRFTQHWHLPELAVCEMIKHATRVELITSEFDHYTCIIFVQNDANCPFETFNSIYQNESNIIHKIMIKIMLISNYTYNDRQEIITQNVNRPSIYNNQFKVTYRDTFIDQINLQREIYEKTLISGDEYGVKLFQPICSNILATEIGRDMSLNTVSNNIAHHLPLLKSKLSIELAKSLDSLLNMTVNGANNLKIGIIVTEYMNNTKLVDDSIKGNNKLVNLLKYQHTRLNRIGYIYIGPLTGSATIVNSDSRDPLIFLSEFNYIRKISQVNANESIVIFIESELKSTIEYILQLPSELIKEFDNTMDERSQKLLESLRSINTGRYSDVCVLILSIISNIININDGNRDADKQRIVDIINSIMEEEYKISDYPDKKLREQMFQLAPPTTSIIEMCLYGLGILGAVAVNGLVIYSKFAGGGPSVVDYDQHMSKLIGLKKIDKTKYESTFIQLLRNAVKEDNKQLIVKLISVFAGADFKERPVDTKNNIELSDNLLTYMIQTILFAYIPVYTNREHAAKYEKPLEKIATKIEDKRKSTELKNKQVEDKRKFTMKSYNGVKLNLNKLYTIKNIGQ